MHRQFGFPFGQIFGGPGQVPGGSYGPSQPPQGPPFGGGPGQPPQGPPFGGGPGQPPQGPPFGGGPGQPPQGPPFGGGPGQPPQGPPFGGGGQGGQLPPPPESPPSSQNATLFAVDPGSLYGCLYRYTWVRMENGRAFWFYPTFIGRTSVAGYRWQRRRRQWIYTGFDTNRIASFQCR